MDYPLVGYLDDEDTETVEAGLDMDLDEDLRDPLGGGFEPPEKNSLKNVEADDMMQDNTDVKVKPESGDGPDVDDPEPTIEAVELGTESRRAMRKIDEALRELDNL